MRAIPYFLIVLLATLQALVAAYWVKAGAARRFAEVLGVVYGGLPPWSALAFSLGWYWLALPLAGSAWLLLAWRRHVDRRAAWGVSLVSLLVFLAMLYAMYPLHLMYAGH